MFDQFAAVVDLIVESFLHVWPYLVVTIPLAVAVRMSGASRYISRAFLSRPILAIVLATAVGAFSPFCSCGVVPVVAALLISGVPLAPVMSFWIASPSMDPEIFFLSVGTIGWELAVWRLAATLVLSLGAGLITHYLQQQGWLGSQILRDQKSASQTIWDRIRQGWHTLREGVARTLSRGAVPAGPGLTPAIACCGNAGPVAVAGLPLDIAAAPGANLGTDVTPGASAESGRTADDPAVCASSQGGSCSATPEPFGRRLLSETWAASWMVVKFMLLAFALSALIKLYVPSEWVVGLLGNRNPWAIPFAALLGVPAYTSNLTALPMLSGLLAQGMSPSAALAFLISGPTTTLPAMAAVWGLASRRVFALYVSFSLVGSVVLGLAHSLVMGLL